MELKDIISILSGLFQDLSEDLLKASRGNKTAAQRVRVRTIELEKIAKQFRKESLAAEKEQKTNPKEDLKT